MDDIIKLSHDQRLDRLAEIAVHVGIRLALGQELVISAPIEALPLVRRITEQAYKAGASLVTALFNDDASTLLRFKHAPEESFDKASWLYDAMGAAFSNGAAWLVIAGDDPALLAGQDPDKVARGDRARWPGLQRILNFDVNWSAVSYATPAWAKAVFPKDAEEVALNKLWDAIFPTSRVDTPDPTAAWHAHNDALLARTNFLNDKRFSAVQIYGRNWERFSANRSVQYRVFVLNGRGVHSRLRWSNGSRLITRVNYPWA
jgi:aminopeptidase